MLHPPNATIDVAFGGDPMQLQSSVAWELALISEGGTAKREEMHQDGARRRGEIIY